MKSIATEKLIAQLHDALYLASLLCYSQGLAMLHKASAVHQMDVPLNDVVRIWRGGCIIRSSMLEIFLQTFRKEPALSNLLLDRKISAIVKKKQGALRKTVQLAAAARIPAGGLMSTLAYLDAYLTGDMATNLIQAQRDYFGAHKYERKDQPGVFHTEWTDPKQEK